jgi:hypothetical protein
MRASRDHYSAHQLSFPQLPDPRAWPAATDAPSRAADLYAIVDAALNATTQRAEERHNADASCAITAWLHDDSQGLARAFENAPSVAIARQLRRLLLEWERGSEERRATLHLALFAMPLVLVAALDASAPPITLPCVLSQMRGLQTLLRDAKEFGGAGTFAISSGVTEVDAIEVAQLPALLSRVDRVTEDAAPSALDIPPVPLVVDSRAERVALRFLVGSVLTAPRADPFEATSIGKWGIPFAQEVTGDLRVPGVSLLALPRPPERLVRAVSTGRAIAREVSAQVFASNAIRRFRSSVGEPTATIDVERDDDRPGRAFARVSLSSPFATQEPSVFRCSIYPYEPVNDVIAMLVTLLRDCRIEDIRAAPSSPLA